MNWIQGVRWAPNGFFLQAVNHDHVERVTPVRELQSVLSSSGNNAKFRGVTSFSIWHRLMETEVVALAEELGFSGRLQGQSFYAFEVDGQRHILPAGVLMCAMFRPFHGIAKYIFAPQGLDNLCRPHQNREKPEMLFFVNPRTATGMQGDKAEGILNSLSWMQCFPSGRSMWCSALDHATEGQLDVTLPEGEIHYFGSGNNLRSGDVLIHDLRVRLLETDEAPFEQFSMHTRAIEFERILHKLDTSRQRRTCARDDTIPLRNGDWALTDLEWSAVRDEVIRKRSRGTEDNIRRILNLQLQKLSQGLLWAGVAPEMSDRFLCSTYLNRMKKDGRWDVLIEKLAQLRPAA